MLNLIIKYLKRRSKPQLIILALVYIILQGVVDYFTGDFSLLIFDLVPIFVVTWLAGMRWGIVISFISVTSWAAVDIMTTPVHSNPVVYYWNFSIKFIFFVSVISVLMELKKALQREKELARIDYLTGALNNRSFCEASYRELDIARRHKRPLTFAYMDLDDFKLINDRFGHSAGDALLRLTVENIKKHLRSSDIIARMGGDEFAIIFPETTHESAVTVLNRIKELLTDALQRSGWPSTFSMGVVTYMNPTDSIDEMVKKADRLMYEAKNSGKNIIKYEVLGE